jgi:hypothetical protein
MAMKPGQNPAALNILNHTLGGLLCRRSRPIWAVVTITITPAAFAAIASTLPKGSTVVGRPYGRGYAVTLDQPGFDRLTAERRRGESYSDVILRLAKG